MFSRPFDDFFGSPADTSAGITAASFEPFATRGIPLLLKANLINETLPDTYEITERGSVALQELEKRMDQAKLMTERSSSLFGPDMIKRGTQVEQPNARDAFIVSRHVLKTLWTGLGASVYEVEEPTYLRPSPTGVRYHLYASMQDGSQTLLHCSGCSTTQIASYALTRPKKPLHSPGTSTKPSCVNVSLSAFHHPICDMFYALVTRVGTIPHEERIRAALLASCSASPPGSPRTSSPSVPSRILVDDAAGVALLGQAAQLWFDRLRLSIEQACPKVMDGRLAELDRHLGRVFDTTAPGTSSTGSPSSLVPHYGQAHKGHARGFILGNFRTAGEASEETCMSCSGPLESVRGAWVAKVALSESETGNERENGEVTVRVLNPLPMLAALAATGTLLS